jgi:UDP-GlcNAc3NAcA epimerase
MKVLTILGARPQFIKAYFFQKPCITLRDETEWIGLIGSEANILVGANKDKIVKTFQNIFKLAIDYSKSNLYGGGKTSESIVRKLKNG